MRGKRLLSLTPPLIGIGLFLLYPGSAAAGVRDGLRLCAELLVPALFPVSVLSGCLVLLCADAGARPFPERLMRSVFGLSGSCVLPLILGFLGGFPLGAQLSASMFREGRISRREADQLAPFCNQAGPGFLFGVVGRCLGTAALGGVLCLIQLAAALSAALLLRQPGPPPVRSCPAKGQTPSFSAALPRALGSSAAAMLRLCGSVALFQALLRCLGDALPISALSGIWRAGVCGMLELSGGVAALSALDQPGAFLLAAAMINWGGLCVHLQASEALGAAGLACKRYLLGKLLQACFAMLYGTLFLFLCGLRPGSTLLLCACLPLLIIFANFKKIHWKKEKLVL